MIATRFRAHLSTEDDGFFIEVPFDVKEVFGRARPPIKVSVAGYSFPTTVSVYGGRYYLPVRRDRREAAGIGPGDLVDVMMELDETPRTVEVPLELAQALAKNKAAKAAWARLSYSHQREHAKAIVDAKRPETRARRAARSIDTLLGRGAPAASPKRTAKKVVKAPSKKPERVKAVAKKAVPRSKRARGR